MYANQLISQVPLVPHDALVGEVLITMGDEWTHLPVTKDDFYVGLLEEERLLDASESELITDVIQYLPNPHIKPADYFLLAARRCRTLQLPFIPVVGDDMEYIGVVKEIDTWKQAATLMGLDETGGIVVVDMEKHQFSVSEINRLVESNDAYITQLNTQQNSTTGILTVTIRINKAEVSDIIATLQRYEYNIRFYYGEELYQNEIQHNYNNLINYLNL